MRAPRMPWIWYVISGIPVPPDICPWTLGQDPRADECSSPNLLHICGEPGGGSHVITLVLSGPQRHVIHRLASACSPTGLHSGEEEMLL